MDQGKKEQLKKRFTQPDEFSSWDLIKIGMESKAKLFVAPLQDLLNLDDAARLNKPGTIEGNWSWRLSIGESTLEAALKKYGDLAKFYNRRDILIDELN